MKVSIVTITNFVGGSFDVITKAFNTFDNAAKYLYKYYHNLKEKNGEVKYNIDVVSPNTENGLNSFFLQYEDLDTWFDAKISTMEVEGATDIKGIAMELVNGIEDQYSESEINYIATRLEEIADIEHLTNDELSYYCSANSNEMFLCIFDFKEFDKNNF